MSRTSRLLGLGAVLTLAAASGSAFAAKTLVYCSEGSPEGFNPQFFTTGTTLDASSVPLFNRLVEFDLGAKALDKFRAALALFNKGIAVYPKDWSKPAR